LFKLRIQVWHAQTMTTDPLYDSTLAALTAAIETRMGWGNGLQWATRDFEHLSVQIHERTGVQLSVVTLKRVWGKIAYTGKPTITTLNALAEFAGAQSWQQFKQLNNTSSVHGANESTAGAEVKRRPLSRWAWGVALACTAAVVFYVTAFRPSATSRGKTFSFSSKKVVDTGVPNTVIFEYDATDCNIDDSVSIQQSWDPRLTTSVNSKLRTHTSIYYYPGFFDARLKVNNEVVSNHRLLIKSKGWLPLLETSPVPVYFDPTAALQKGRLSISLEHIRETGIPLQPDAPWCSFYNVGDMPEIKSDDFIFEATIRNDFGEGAAVCRNSEVHILFEGGRW
jgi:hypothetical protein